MLKHKCNNVHSNTTARNANLAPVKKENRLNFFNALNS